MVTLVHILVLVENQADAPRLVSIRILQGRRGVQFMLCTLEQDGAMTERDGHAAYVLVSEVLLVVTMHLVEAIRIQGTAAAVTFGSGVQAVAGNGTGVGFARSTDLNHVGDEISERAGVLWNEEGRVGIIGPTAVGRLEEVVSG